MNAGQNHRVTFLREPAVCHSAKEAFAWLVLKLIDHCPRLLEDDGWEADFGYPGTKRRLLARSPEGLFAKGSKTGPDSGHFADLGNGWYLLTNLSNDAKMDVNVKMTAVVGLAHPADWTWESPLISREEPSLDELLGLRNEDGAS